MPGALVFGAATSDRVDVAEEASINDLAAFSVLMWVNPTTLSNLRFLWTKRVTATGIGKRIILSGTGGNLQINASRLTTNVNYITNSTPLAATGTWIFLALAFDVAAAAGEVVNIYSGTPGTLAAEATFGTATDGSGTLRADSPSGVMRWGNSETAAPTAAFQGLIGPCAFFGAALSLADVQSWQQLPRKTVGANVALRFYRFGKDGADAIEYTGAGNGTVTGATQGDGPPVGGHWTRGENGLYRRAA